MQAVKWRIALFYFDMNIFQIFTALELCRTLEGDFFSLAGAAGLSQPWRAEALRRQWDPSSLEVSVSVTAKLERSYDAG